MARILTSGAESGDLTIENVASTVTNSGVVGFDTITFRSGARSFKCSSNDPVSRAFIKNSGGFTAVLGTTYFGRAYLNFTNLPTNTFRIVDWTVNNTQIIGARISAVGKLQLWNETGTPAQIGSDSVVTLVTGKWYRIELKLSVAAGPLNNVELQLDGVSVASATGLALTASTATWLFQAGFIGTSGIGGGPCYIDDYAINDSTGASQTSWPGSGKVVLLLPISDSAGGTGWTLGTGTALGGNGFKAVSNTPPQGVADLTAGSDTKQIRNAASAANSNYDANLRSYSTAGILTGATINVLVPVIATAAPVSTSAKLGTVGIASNPAIANIALGAAGTSGAFWQGNAAGTYAAGWKVSYGTTTYAPSVTLGTSPVMRVTQVTASTRIAMVCFMGMQVDYTPASTVKVPIMQLASAMGRQIPD